MSHRVMLTIVTSQIHGFISWFQDALFRQLLQNTGWLLSGSIIATALSFLSTVIKARALGSELYGLLAVIMAYVAVIGGLATFQPWQALIKFGAESLERKQEQEFMGLVKLSLFLDIVSAVLGTTVATAGAYIFASWQGWDAEASRMAAVFSLSLLFNWSGTPTGILRLLDRFEMFTAQKIISAVCGLFGVVIVSIMDGGIWGFLLVTLAARTTGNLFLLLVGYRSLKARNLLRYSRGPVTNWRRFLRFSIWSYLTSTLDLPVKQFDLIIVSTVVSLEATGIYQIIKQVAKFLGVLANPIYQAVYPQFAIMISNDERKEAKRYALKIGFLIAASVGSLSLLLALTSRWWLGAVFGESFTQGWISLSIFLLFQSFSLAFIAIHPLLLAMGYVKQITTISLVTNVVYAFLAYFGGMYFGLIGVVIAAGIQIMLVISWKVLYINQDVRLSFAGEHV